MTTHTYAKEKEYFRLVGQIYLTEDGAYKELPDDVTFAYIQIEAVYILVLVTSSGELRVQSFANTPAMDKADVTGGPVIFGTDTIFTEPGAGTATLTLSRNYSPYLSTAERTKADTLWDNLLAGKGKWYE